MTPWWSGGRRVLVFCAGTSWDGVPGSDRRLATALRRHLPVLWVDPPVSPATPDRNRHGAGRTVRPRLVEVDPRMRRLTPVGPPGLSRRGVREVTYRMVRAQVRWALRRSGTRAHAVLAASLDGVLGGWGSDVRTVLYGTDDWVAGARLMGLPETTLLREERRALAAAGVVLAVSPPLRDRWAAMGADPVLLPNGVDAGAYAACAPSPSGPDGTGDPVAGLVGQLSDRIDLDLLDAVAGAGCSLLLVGPHDPAWQPERFARLAARPGVTWVGRVPPGELPAYLSRMSVGITPYRDTPFNRASFPLKTLEYLAAGLPAVSTDLPAVRWLGTDLVRTARSATDFAAQVRAAATDHSTEAVARRRALAALHSWERRAGDVARVLGLPEEPAGHPTGAARTARAVSTGTTRGAGSPDAGPDGG